MPTKTQNRTRRRTLKSHPLEDPALVKEIEKFFTQLNFEKEAAQGTLECIWETGMEEIAWCFKANRSPKGAYPYCLKDGDTLAIYDRNDKKKIIWLGEISLYGTTHRVNIRLLSIPMGTQKMRQKYQKGIAKKKWRMYFFEHYPAALVKKKKIKTSS